MQDYPTKQTVDIYLAGGRNRKRRCLLASTEASPNFLEAEPKNKAIRNIIILLSLSRFFCFQNTSSRIRDLEADCSKVKKAFLRAHPAENCTPSLAAVLEVQSLFFLFHGLKKEKLNSLIRFSSWMTSCSRFARSIFGRPWWICDRKSRLFSKSLCHDVLDERSKDTKAKRSESVT